MVNSVLALDVGTSMVKAVVVNAGGAVAAEAATPVAHDGQPGLDTSALWRVVIQTMADTLKRLGQAQQPEAIIISAQGDGLWLVGDDGAPLTRAYLWNSSEGADVVARWDTDGVIDEHFRSSGTVLWPGSQAALWRWWRDSHPDEASTVRSVMCAKDLIGYLLTGEIRTDLTDASIPFVDPGTGDYDDAAFGRLGCEDLRSRVAPIGRAGEVLGAVTAEASSQTGLAEGIPVYLGAIDVVAMLWGQGLGDSGDVLAILGTTALSASVTQSRDFSADPAGATLSLGDGRYLRAMGSSAGAATLEWFLSTVGYGGDDRYEVMWAELADAPPGEELFLPYLSGERAPILAPFATGVFHGLTPQSTRGSMARAVTEGIAMAMCRGIDQVQGPDATTGQVVLSGGGSQATPWAQQVANILGRPVAIDQRPHVGALGIAGLVIDAPIDSSARRIIEPDQEAGALQRRYSQFVDLTNTLIPWWTTHHRS